MTKFNVNNWTHEKLTSICFFTITHCLLSLVDALLKINAIIHVSVCLLTMKISHNEGMRISAVIVKRIILVRKRYFC